MRCFFRQNWAGALKTGALGLFAAVVSAAVAAEPASAQLTLQGVRTEKDLTNPEKPSPIFGARAFFGEIGEDFFLSAVFRLNYDTEDWGIGVQAPLRFRLRDRDPNDEGDILGVIRKQDWDQRSELLRFLQYVYVGEPDKGGQYYLLGGMLNRLTMGSGTILHGYYNNTDLSHWRGGLNAHVDLEVFTAEVMLNDLLDPNLFGVRAALRPFELGWRQNFLDKLEVGASFFMDWSAPFQLRRVPIDPTMPDGPSRILVSDEEVPIVESDKLLTVIGIDTRLPMQMNDVFSITPYTDINWMNVVAGGWGWHMGALWSLHFPYRDFDTWDLDLRTEFRVTAGDYLGPYFNSVYEIERYQRLARRGGTGNSKLRSLCSNLTCDGGSGGARGGLFLEATLKVPDIVYAGVEYLFYGGPRDDGSFRVYVEVPVFYYFQVKAFFYRFNIGGFDEVFKFDDRTALLLEARIPIAWIFSINGRWLRLWQANDVGGYQSTDDWSVGVGVYIKF